MYLLKNLFQDRTKVNIVNVDFVIKFFNKQSTDINRIVSENSITDFKAFHDENLV